MENPGQNQVFFFRGKYSSLAGSSPKHNWLVSGHYLSVISAKKFECSNLTYGNIQLHHHHCQILINCNCFLRSVPQARQKSACSRNVQHCWLPHSAGLLSTEFFFAERFWNADGLHKSVVIQRYSESMCWKQELFFPPKYQKIFLTMHKCHHNLTLFTTKEKNYIK